RKGLARMAIRSDLAAPASTAVVSRAVCAAGRPTDDARHGSDVMSNELLAWLIFGCGVAHFAVLSASALVPNRLNWREEFRTLSPLHRQLYWVYGGYVVLS